MRCANYTAVCFKAEYCGSQPLYSNSALSGEFGRQHKVRNTPAVLMNRRMKAN